MSEPSEFRFLRYGVRVRIFEDDRYLETIMRDETKVPAAPQDDEAYRQTARDLGYGDDVWRMCKEHEIAHTELMQALGLQYSPTLWAVAHGHKAGILGNPGEMAAEEQLVLAYQRWRLVRAV